MSSLARVGQISASERNTLDPPSVHFSKENTPDQLKLEMTINL